MGKGEKAAPGDHQGRNVIDATWPKVALRAGGSRVIVAAGHEHPPTSRPSMMLGKMRKNGVRSLVVSCWNCYHAAIMSADPWPD
jgi:hypothetical protein